MMVVKLDPLPLGIRITRRVVVNGNQMMINQNPHAFACSLLGKIVSG